jgi:hypothetical protein
LARRSPRDSGIGGLFDQDAFMIETEGMVLLSREIRIRVTPSSGTGVF